jgi:hypothetical protein
MQNPQLCSESRTCEYEGWSRLGLRLAPAPSQNGTMATATKLATCQQLDVGEWTSRMAKQSLNVRLAPPITAARASAAPARPANIDADAFAAFRVFSGEAEDMVFVLSPEASPAPPSTHPATFAPQQPA